MNYPPYLTFFNIKGVFARVWGGLLEGGVIVYLSYIYPIFIVCCS